MPTSYNRDRLLKSLRLAPPHLTSENSDFIYHVYRTALDREPEADMSSWERLESRGDIYACRIDYIKRVSTSVESRMRGYDAMTRSFPVIFGCRDAAVVSTILRDLYDSHEAFVSNIAIICAHAIENTRNQELALAMSAY